MIKKFRPTKKIVLIGTIVLLLVTLGIGLYYNHYRSPAGDSSEPINPINYDPPTEEEQAQANTRKDEIVDEQSRQPAAGAIAVTPVITNASQVGREVTVNAYLSGVIEDSGTCTAVFSKGASKVTKTSDGVANASTTDCTPIRVDRAEFPDGGDWQVVVSYNSSKASGSSQIKVLTLQ